MIKLLLYPLLAIVLLVSVCMHTKPAPERHVQEVSAHVISTLRDYSHEGVSIPPKVIERIESDSLVNKMLEKVVIIEDHAAFSLCKVVAADEEYFLSVGLFDRIVILPKEGITEMLFLKLREKRIID